MRAAVAANADWPALPTTVPQLALPVGAQVTAASSVTPVGSPSLTVTSSASEAPVLTTCTT